MSQSALNKKVEALTQDLFESTGTEAGTPAWKQEAAARLAAHRNRRGSATETAGRGTAESPRAASGRAAEAARRVAARYAKAPSYSEVLAGEARAVVRAAGAAAEAARSAQAAAQAVLAGLEFGFETGFDAEPAAPIAASEHTPVSRWQDEPPAAAPPAAQLTPWAGAQPRWEEALPVTAAAPSPGATRDVWAEMRVHPVPEAAYRERYEHGSDEGELFPFDPVAGATVEPIQHLPANLIEFPRELVATRKARPRLAEGPLYDAAQDSPQLSIFEVDPALLAPPVYLHEAAVAPPEWASIELEHREEVEEAHSRIAGPVEAQYSDVALPEQAYPEYGYAAVEDLPAVTKTDVLQESLAQPQMGLQAGQQMVQQVAPRVSAPAVELLVARRSDRLLAAVVDAALVTLAFLAAAVVVIASTAHPPTGKIALIASGVGLLLFGLLYQFLFLSYAEEGTPGMRYARIALCTFDDDNPTVDQMRMRIPALLVAAAPAGLGLLWSLVDGDGLGWHDRLTKTYQRKY